MHPVQRPKRDETDEDLIRQDSEFKSTSAGKNFKRKNESISSTDFQHDEDATKSKFAQSRSKKKKEGIIDHTILVEAASKDSTKNVVLGSIVERNVPPITPFQINWKPKSFPSGFPKPEKLDISNTTKGIRGKKSLYMQQMEKLHSQKELPKTECIIPREEGPIDGKLAALGAQCYILSNANLEESHTLKIHEENLEKISQMSHEERLEERNNLMSLLTAEQIAFVRSLSNRSSSKDLKKRPLSQDARIGDSPQKKEHSMEVEDDDVCNAPIGFSRLRSIDGAYMSAGYLAGKKYKEGTLNENTEAGSILSNDESFTGKKLGPSVDEGMEVDGDVKTDSKCQHPESDTMSPPKLSDQVCNSHERKLFHKSKFKKRVSFSEEVKEIKSTEEPAEIPAEIRAIGNWRNLGKIELDKLRWMSDLPQVKLVKNTDGFVARFNFVGEILPYDAEVSIKEGLHHHGDEPSRAGYTIDELFVFARSQVIQQRHIGLGTLANILRNSKEGLYDTGLETPIVQLLIDAGLVLLLRFALDDPIQLVYQEAIRGLYHLLCSSTDEQCLSLFECWEPLGGFSPGFSSLVHAKEKYRTELDSEEKELKDFEILQLDVIRALIRMDTHLRLRYFLEKIKPSPPVVLNILGILTRMGRHSLTAAWTLATTPRLVSTIVENFIPYNVSPLVTGSNVESMSSVYGVPLRHALTFLKVISARGRQISTNLMDDHGLMKAILAYVVMEPSEVAVPHQEALMLAQEAYAIWSTFLSYGIAESQQAFSTFYPQIIKQLIFYRDKVDINKSLDENKFNYNVGAYMLDVARKALCVSASTNLASLVCNKSEIERPDSYLDWENFRQITELVEVCATKWTVQLAGCDTSFLGKRLLGACFLYLNTFYKKWRDQRSFEGGIFVKTTENLYTNLVITSLRSTVFQQLSDNLVKLSALANSRLYPGNGRDSANLSTLGSVTRGGEVVPIVQSNSSLPFLLPFVSFMYTLHKGNPSLSTDYLLQFLDDPCLKLYVKQFIASPKHLSNNWFVRAEVYFLRYVVLLSSIKLPVDAVLYHSAALALIPCISKGDDHLVKEILQNVVFNAEFLADLTNVESRINLLSVEDFKPLKSPTVVQPILNTGQLLDLLVNNIASVGTIFTNAVVSKDGNEQGIYKENAIHFLLNNLTVELIEPVAVYDEYWPLEPLKELSNTKTALKAKENAPQTAQCSSDQSSVKDILLVTRSLQTAFLLVKCRKSAVPRMEPIGWLRHLSAIFLVSNDLFLDVTISSYLQACVLNILEDKQYAKLNWKLECPPQASCYEWYKEMIEQYASVSYGDSTFSLFIIMPLQRYWPDNYKMLLFGDLAEALPFISLSCSDVQQFIPLQQFLMPAEESEQVLVKYMSALGSGLVSEKRTPFLYRLTTHHITQWQARRNPKEETVK